MAEINFPKNPADNQTFVVGSKTWIWKESIGAWVIAPPEDLNSLLRNVNTDFIPSIDSEYNLGSETKKWKDLYLSGDTIHLGELKLREENGSLSVISKDTDEINPIKPISGGTGLTSYAKGDIIYASDNNILDKLSVPSEDNNTFLFSVVDGLPAWVEAANLTGLSGGASVTTSDTAPEDPSEGDLWWDSAFGKLKIYYYDGDTFQWVDAAGAGIVGPAGPIGPQGEQGIGITDITQDGSTLSITYGATGQTSVISGFAILTEGKLNPNVLPSLAITETFVVVSEAAMLALTAERGDVAIRTDINKTFILSTDNPGTLNDWKEILTPADGVTSVQLSVPTGLVVNTQPITSTGTIEIDYANGYTIPTSAKQSQWDKAYESLDTEFVSTINSLDRLLIETFDLVDLLTFSSEELTPPSSSYTKSLSSPQPLPASDTYTVNLSVSFTTGVPLESIIGTLLLFNDDVDIGGIDFGFYNIPAGNNTLQQDLTLNVFGNPTEFDAINVQLPAGITFNSIIVKKLADSPSSYKSISSDILSDKITKPSLSVIENNFASFANTSGDGLRDSGVDVNTFGLKNNGTFSSPTFTGVTNISTIVEKANVVATAPPNPTTLNIDTAAVWYYTSSTSGNFTLNITGTTTINNRLTTGQSLTVALMVTCGATPHYPTAIQIDGLTGNRTLRWQGGIAPTSGNANSVDIYSFTVVKTGNNTFQVFGAQSRFA
jgi:hypothetical protein